MLNLWLIPALPFLGFLANGIFGKRFPKLLVNIIAVGSVALSFLWVLKTLSALGSVDPSRPLDGIETDIEVARILNRLHTTPPF